MRLLMTVSVLPLLVVGCIQGLLDEAAGLSPDPETSPSSESTSTGEPPSPTTSMGSGVQTVTGPPDETTEAVETTTAPGTSTGAPEENVPPTVKLKVEPSYLSEAGKALLWLDASADVVSVRLSLNGGEPAELTPAEFPYTYEALSAKDNGLPHVFTVEVEDDEGLKATDGAELTVQLPASGAERCLFEDKMAVQSAISALVYTDTAILAAGWRDTGAGPRAAIWKLDPDHCEAVLPGWPKTIGNWTGDMDLAALTSLASAIAVDDAGNLAVGVTLVAKDNTPQRYVAFLTPGGSLLWEKLGKFGEEVAGIAITPDTVVAVGWVRTSENPVRTDAMIWRHLERGTVWPETLKAPFTDAETPDPNNEYSEWSRAVLYDRETDLLIVAGDREFKGDDNKISPRAFIARFVPLGGKYGKPWTSSGDPLKKDGALSVARCGADVVVGGWTQDEPPGSLPQPLTRWLDMDGTADTRVPEQLSDAQTLGIACDREGKVVHAARRSLGQLDAQVFAVDDPKAPRLWYDKGSAGSDAAHTVDCDARGFCAWGGFRTVDGKIVAVVRGHHP